MHSRIGWTLAALLATTAADAAVGSWSTTGPHGGAVNKIEYHRGNPAIAYAAGDGGFFRSTDGGQTWRAAEVGLPPGLYNPEFWQAPSNGNVLYLLSFTTRSTLYRSADAGLTWSRLPPVSTNPRNIEDLAISPDNPNQLAVVYTDQLRKSADGGQTFTTAAFPPAPFEALAVAIFGSRFLIGGSNSLVTGQLFDSFEGIGGFDNAGWSHQALNGSLDWTWSTTQSSSPAHSWHAASATVIGDRVLKSPALPMVPGSSLSFRHTFAFETDGGSAACYDAGRLEVSSDGGSSWSPLPDTAFELGGYNDTVDGGFGNVLAGQRAWCQGTIGSMTQVRVNLSAYAGQTIQVRWHAADDNSGAAAGWFVDDVFFTNDGPLVYRSTDSGASFAPTQVVAASDAVIRLQFAPGSNQVAYYGLAGEHSGRTIDGGLNWSENDAQLDLRKPFWIHPTNALQLIAARADRLVGSNDGGMSVGTLGVTVTPTLSAVSAIASYPATPTLLAGTSGRGILRSTDNAGSFSESFAGFGSFNVRALAIPVNHPNRVLAAQGDVGFSSHALLISGDAGTSWSSSNALGALSNNVRALAIDPTTSGPTVYAVGRLFAPPLAQNGGIYRSIDGGTSWTVNSNGIPAQGSGRSMGLVRAIAIDPRSCLSPPPSGPCSSGPLRTIYVIGTGRPDQLSGGWTAAMLYKSTDGGASWNRADSGLPSPGPGFENQVLGVSLVMDPINTNTLYVGLAAQYGNIGAPNGNIAGIYKTSNGGTSWTAANNGLPGRPGATSLPPDVLALAIDPTAPATLYAGVSVGDFPGAPLAGVYRSSDGGLNWSNASNGLVGADVRALLVDRNNPSTVYAGAIGTFTNPGGVYKSLNSGGIWRSISGTLPSSSVYALARDPADPATVYAGTNTGVWKLTQVPDDDGDGAASSIENAAPNAGDGNADGIPDAQQADVATIFNPPLGSFLRGRENHTTMGGEDANLRTGNAPKGSSCTQLTDAYAIDPRIYPPDPQSSTLSFNHDEFGLVNVEIPDCSSLELTIRYPDGNFLGPEWSWRNYGPSIPGDDTTVGWYAYTNAVKVNATTWRLTVNANQLGSWRASSDHILFRGGPALSGEVVFRDSFE